MKPVQITQIERPVLRVMNQRLMPRLQGSRVPVIGDVITFVCNGQGRGGHYHVTCKIEKFNRKTIGAVELPRSYRPGTKWVVNFETESLAIEEGFYTPEEIAANLEKEHRKNQLLDFTLNLLRKP
jgi:hypothetical protein